MNNIKIEWLDDESDCDDCGATYARGANVWFGEQLLLELAPSAGCCGSDDWSESEVYKEILYKLGYDITEV
jgi:hypothetical protein